MEANRLTPWFSISILLGICVLVQAQMNDSDTQILTKWSVKAGNVTCILFTGSVEIEVEKPDSNGMNTKYQAKIPSNAKANGTCGPIAQDITLSWSSNGVINSTNNKAPVQGQSSLQFKFWKECNYAVNMSVCTYKLGAISGSVEVLDSTTGNSTTQFIRIPMDRINYNLEDTETSCNITKDTLTTADGSTTLKLDNFMVQAFRTAPDQTFSDKVILCKPTVANIGSWIGGIVAVLIIIAAIALSAYFIIKKKRLSYTTMP